MWNSITPAEIDQAKHEIDLRRAETLRRHAAEINALDAERNEIDTLDRLVSAFAEKYQKPLSKPEDQLFLARA